MKQDSYKLLAFLICGMVKPSRKFLLNECDRKGSTAIHIPIGKCISQVVSCDAKDTKGSSRLLKFIVYKSDAETEHSWALKQSSILLLP
nr:hypothetical protein [Tanacetum cinerariifolium]